MKTTRYAMLSVAFVCITAAVCSSWGAFKRPARPDPADDSPAAATKTNGVAGSGKSGTSVVTTVSGTGVAASGSAKAGGASASNICDRLRAGVLAGEKGKMPIRELLAALGESPGGREGQEILTAIAVRKAEALVPIQEMLRSGTLWEKLAVVKLLGVSPWPETYEELLHLALDSKEHVLTRQGALLALGALGNKAAGGAILEMLEDPALSPGVQLPAISALARIGYAEAVEPLRAFTTNDNRQVSLFAWRALQELGQAADRDFLLPILEDKDYVMRGDACGALALVDGDAIVLRLRQVAEQDENQAVRQEAHQALIRRALNGRSPSEKSILLQGELEKAEFFTRTWILRTLLEEGGEAGRAVVEAMVGKDDRMAERAETYLLWNAARQPI